MSYPPPPPTGPPPASPTPGPTEPAEEAVLFRGVPAALPSVWLRWIITLGLYEIWRRHNQFVVTNRRVIWRKGVFHRSERSIPMRWVQDVTSRKGLMHGWVELSSAGGSEGVEVLGPLWNGSVDRLVAAIDREVH